MQKNTRQSFVIRKMELMIKIWSPPVILTCNWNCVTESSKVATTFHFWIWIKYMYYPNKLWKIVWAVKKKYNYESKMYIWKKVWKEMCPKVNHIWAMAIEWCEISWILKKKIEGG